VSVCLHDRTKTADTTIAKLATAIVRHESWLPFKIRSKGQRSRSQGYKVQKHISIEGGRVAGVSLYSIECPSSRLLLNLFNKALCIAHNTLLHIIIYIIHYT